MRVSNRILREGIAGTAMLPVPADTPDPTVWQTVTYLNTLRTDPANIDLPGSVSEGSSLYSSSDCASCHMIGGQGGRLGPDLSFVGEDLDPDELKTALLDPDEDVSPRWWTVRVTQRDGSVVEGLRMSEDTFGLRVMDERRQPLVIPEKSDRFIRSRTEFHDACLWADT